MNPETKQLVEQELATLPPAAKDLVIHILAFQAESEMSMREFSTPLRQVLDLFERVLERIKEDGSDST